MKRVLPLFAVLLLVPLAAAGTPQLSVNTGNGQACPTGSGQYTVQLHNPGPAGDRYTIDVEGPWTGASTLPTDTVRIDPGGTERIPLWVQAPKTAAPGEHQFTVSATSSNNGDTAIEPGTLNVLSCRSVALETVEDRQQVCRGDEAVYRIDIENQGQVEETYELSADAGQLSTDTVTLDSGDEQTVTLTLSSTEEMDRTVRVRADSTTSYATDTTDIEFVAEACRDVDVSVAPETASLCNSDDFLLTATVANNGRINDTYRVAIGGETRNVSVAAGQTVTVEESIPAADITGNIQVSATSTSLARVQDSAMSEVSIDRCHDLSLEPVTTAPEAGNRTLVEFALTNNGTQTNTYTVELDGPDWMDAEPANVSLEPNDTAPVYVYMAPDFFGDGTYTATMVVSGQGVRNTVQMNATARNGTVTLEMAGTRTPVGRITGQSSGIAAVIVTALILLIGGYYFLRREEVGVTPSTQMRDYHKSADDVLDQNTNTVVKGLRDDNLSDEFLEVLMEEEKQGKNRNTVINEIRNQLEE